MRAAGIVVFGLVCALAIASCGASYAGDDGSACTPRSADCDGNPDNGCETNTSTSVADCGTCGHACQFAPNGYPVCEDGACKLGCNTGFFDCDGDPANGCEIDGNSDPSHCGGCATLCGARVVTPGARCELGKCSYPTSCNTVAKPALSGLMRIDPDAKGPFDTYCEMEKDGGGWTLLVKVDGTKPTFVFNSPIWTNEDTLFGTPDLDTSEVKLRGFSAMPFKALRLGMLDGGVHRWIVITMDRDTKSLRDLFAQTATPGGSGFFPPSYAIPNGIGLATWRTLLASPSGQPNCNSQGLNLTRGTGALVVSVRLGIVMNNEMDCDTPDSWIGFGSNNAATTTGNVATAAGGPDNGVRATKTMGYIMIR